MSIETTLTLLVAGLILATAVTLRLIVLGAYRLALFVARRLDMVRPATTQTTPAHSASGLLRNVGSLAQFALAHITAAVAAVATAMRSFGRHTVRPAYRRTRDQVGASLAVDAFPDPLTGPLMLDETDTPLRRPARR